MFWADKIAKKIIDSGKYKPYWVDDMKTPSGKIHAGSLKGVVVHDLLYKALLGQKQKATFSYCINDMDPMDGFPIYLDREKFYKYMGCPLYKIPSPQEGFSSYAEYYAKEFIEVFNKIDCYPQIIWTSNLYADGKFDKLIQIYLDNTDKIRRLFKEQYKNFQDKEYYPYQPICPKCGKIATTRIYKWDGEYVYFECKENATEYTKGCGFKGKVKPEKQNGKLPWKIEWSAHWKTLGVTIEWSGKDHMTAGGSHEIASKICEQIFNYPTPYAESYEHLLLGGRKMSSSKGIGSSAKEVSDILPPYLLRFLFVRVDYRETIDFDPIGNMIIPDLFDEYDRCWQAYNNNSDENLARIFEYSQIDKIPQKTKNLFLPRFRDITNFTQLPNVDLWEKFNQIKGSELSEAEKKILGERLTYAIVWISKYAPDEYKYQISVKPLEELNLTDKQWSFLNDLSEIWGKVKDPEELQSKIFQLTKDKNINYKEAFETLYTVLVDKKHGPRAGWLMKKFPADIVVERLTLNKHHKITKSAEKVKIISCPDLFAIDTKIKEIYPSISIGIAIIKNVNIIKTNPELEREKEDFLESLKGLTTETLGKFPEITSYRRLYKEMGIDWHSRRPSPEALLRRIALNKGLYTVNTCVDAYNLIVMKHRVSVGAFDYNKVKFPTVLRYAGAGDEILLLGDEEPTKYTAKELAYYDKEGGYNIDFNFRDAQRTMVTEQTTDLWINVDGVYDITSEMVARTLRESVELIVKYCGGEVELEGVVI